MAIAGAIALGLAATVPGIAEAAPQPAPTAPALSAAQAAALKAGLSVAPKAKFGTKPQGPNPFLADVPDEAQADYTGWANYLRGQAKAKAAKQAKVSAAVVVDEDEPAGTYGSNDTPANAQRVPEFGTGRGKEDAIRVLGSLDGEAAVPQARAATPEDDGSIPLAGETGIGSNDLKAVKTSATIGDGPHGSAGDATGDFDFYRVDATAGQTLTVDVDLDATSTLDSIALLYSAAGELIAANDDSATGLDSYLQFQVAETGTYYVAISGFIALPADPFDSGSGDGAQSEGDYDVTITAALSDTDFYAVNLRPGDVLGASVTGSATYVTVYDTDPKEVHGSNQDATYIYPSNSPLPGGGNATTDYVATKAGWHYVGVSQGSGAYDLKVEAYRAGLEGTKTEQTLFLDFDGARVNTGIFGGRGNVDLTRFSGFIGKWGITAAQEDALIDAVTASVKESIEHDLAASGLNDRFSINVLNSKDDEDPWGGENVSRIVVGGTIAESGVPTIGIAQSIDPGNFGTEETALVLLDVLSEPAGPETSLNTYLTPESDRIAFVGQAVGNVTAHEAGHFFGNWHTDNQSEHANLQDSGGANFDVLFGVGPDGVGGTADDVDVDFGEDTFSPAEGFVGIEDTAGRLIFGLTS